MSNTKHSINNRYYFMDLLRVLAFSVIILYHFFKDVMLRFIALIPDPDIIIHFGSVHLGMVSVSLFFMISGAGLTLQMNHKLQDSSGTKQDWFQYYRGRFFTILLPFYVSYFFYAIFKLLRTRFTIFAGIPKWRFIFTILGIDEYVQLYGIRDFSLGLGEWFLGALIIIYVIFPIIYICMKRWKLPTLAAFTIYYLVLVLRYNSDIPWHLNMLVKLYEFVLGMFFAMNMEWFKKHWYLFLIIFANAIPSLHPCFVNTLTVSGVFILGILSEDLLHKSAILGKLLKVFGSYSFYIYLIHHAVIYTIDEPLAGAGFGLKIVLLLLIFELLLMCIGAVVLRKIVSWIRVRIDK